MRVLLVILVVLALCFSCPAARAAKPAAPKFTPLFNCPFGPPYPTACDTCIICLPVDSFARRYGPLAVQGIEASEFSNQRPFTLVAVLNYATQTPPDGSGLRNYLTISYRDAAGMQYIVQALVVEPPGGAAPALADYRMAPAAALTPSAKKQHGKDFGKLFDCSSNASSIVCGEPDANARRAANFAFSKVKRQFPGGAARLAAVTQPYGMRSSPQDSTDSYLTFVIVTGDGASAVQALVTQDSIGRSKLIKWIVLSSPGVTPMQQFSCSNPGSITCLPSATVEERDVAKFAAEQISHRSLVPSPPVTVRGVTQFGKQDAAGGTHYYIEMYLDDSKGSTRLVQSKVWAPAVQQGAGQGASGVVQLQIKGFLDLGDHTADVN